MNCSKCGRELAAEAEFCHKCGAKVSMDAGPGSTGVRAVPIANGHPVEPPYVTGSGGVQTAGQRTGPSPLRTILAYAAGAILVAALAAFVPTAMANSLSQWQQLLAGIVNIGSIVLALYALSQWQWFMARNWLLKLILGVVLLVPLGAPVRLLAGFAGIEIGPRIAALAESVWQQPDASDLVNAQPPLAPPAADPAPSSAAPPQPPPPTPVPTQPSPTAAAANIVVRTLYVSAGGEGVYVRRTPNRNDKQLAWPDGTPMGFIDSTYVGWARVAAPDGFVGYVPQEYLADKPPAPKPTATPAGRWEACVWWPPKPIGNGDWIPGMWVREREGVTDICDPDGRIWIPAGY